MKQLQEKPQPNKLRAIAALAKISIINSVRSPSSLFFNFFFPFIFIIVFGLLGQGDASFDVGVRQDSAQSGLLYETLDKVEVLNLITDRSDEKLDEQLKKGQIPVVINISEDGVIEAGGNSIPKYKFDIETSAAAPRDASTINTILEKIINEINNPENTGIPKLISVDRTEVAGRKFEQIDFILPGQLAFALLTNALFGISIAFVTMRKELVIKRIFSTPVNKLSIMLGEVIGKVIIALVQATIIILVGHFAFKFTLANGIETFLSMLLLSFIGIIVFLAFGLFVSGLGDSEDAISPIANLIMMPQLFLSGAFFPIEQFPEFIQPIARILPMSFLNQAFTKVAFEGAPLSETATNIVALLVWGGIMYLISIKLFRWE